MAKVSLDMDVKNEDEPLNSTSRVEPLIQEDETWKLILPKKHQSKIERHKKFLFAYFCTLTALTLLILIIALVLYLDKDPIKILCFVIILLVSRVALCMHTKSVYPNGSLFLLATVLDFLLLSLLFTGTILNYFFLGKFLILGYLDYWFSFSLLALLWTTMIWIVIAAVLIFQNRSHYKIILNLFRRLFKRFEEELKRHIKYD